MSWMAPEQQQQKVKYFFIHSHKETLFRENIDTEDVLLRTNREVITANEWRGEEKD